MTNQNIAECRILLNQLENEENREGALKELKTLFSLKPANEVNTIINDVGITKIVQCLNVSDKTHLDLACEVLKICFDKFPPGDAIKNYTSHVMYMLRHESRSVCQLAVDDVYKIITLDAGLLPVPQYIDVFVAVAQLVGDPNIGVANRAILITSNLLFEAYPKVLEEMKLTLESSASSKCNVYEVIINISTKSYELFQMSIEHGYIDHMITQLLSNDILYELNILELLSRLAVKPYGINHLVKHGALNKISGLIVELPKNPYRGLLTPGYMKFFGCIAHYYPREIFEKYPAIIDLLFDAFETNDQSTLPVTLDTLGFIGCTIEGKLCLTALGSKYIQAVESLTNMIRNSPTEIRVRALHCFANLIGVDKDTKTPESGPIDHRVTLMTREWFRGLNSQPSAMEYLSNMCKNPFPDIRLASFALLDAVCQHQWGAELIARTAGFIEYLLDRNTDHTKECKEAKYDIVKRLLNSAAFDANIITRLQQYVEQGPFYSEKVLEVAMEDGD